MLFLPLSPLSSTRLLDERRLKPNGWEKMRRSTLSVPSAGNFSISPHFASAQLCVVYGEYIHLYENVCNSFCSASSLVLFFKNLGIFTLYKLLLSENDEHRGNVPNGWVKRGLYATKVASDRRKEFTMTKRAAFSTYKMCKVTFQPLNGPFDILHLFMGSRG